MYAVGLERCGAESVFIDVVFLLDRTPVDGVLQVQRVRHTISISGYDKTIVYTALHRVSTAGHEEPSGASLTLDGNGLCVGVVVPK